MSDNNNNSVRRTPLSVLSSHKSNTNNSTNNNNAPPSKLKPPSVVKYTSRTARLSTPNKKNSNLGSKNNEMNNDDDDKENYQYQQENTITEPNNDHDAKSHPSKSNQFTGNKRKRQDDDPSLSSHQLKRPRTTRDPKSRLQTNNNNNNNNTARKTNPVPSVANKTSHRSRVPANTTRSKPSVAGPRNRPRNKPVQNRRTTPTSTPSSTPSHKSRPTTAAGRRTRPGVRSGSNSNAASQNTSNSSSAAPRQKRAKWDLKGRLEDANAELKVRGAKIQELTQQLEELEERHNDIAKEADDAEQLRADMEEIRGHLDEFESAYNETAQELESVKSIRESLEGENSSLKKQLDEIQARLSKTETEYREVSNELDSAKSRIQCLESENRTLSTTVSTQQENIARMSAEAQERKTHIEKIEGISEQRRQEIERLEQIVSEQKSNIEELETKRRQDESLRRKLHNTIQELKGNIRVFCRVRPLIGKESEQQSNAISHLNFPDNGEENAIEVTNAVRDNKKYPFTFDKVFGPKSTQSYVFEEISQLVQSALDGYKVCIFAYGQTGSGKTFTMEGPSGGYASPNERGMIPRAVEQIFATADELKEQGWRYDMTASFLEIYNENIRDLLTKNNDAKHQIKHDSEGQTYVSDLKVEPVQEPSDIYNLLSVATKNRAFAATNCNERSSRSHSVFTLKLTGNNDAAEQTSKGELHLVDLAGSERLAQSKSTGDRLKETQHINKSLSALGDVIMALASKSQRHVPYRNSKLTHLLHNALGGDSKTLMFVNVSPVEENAHETLCSLRFAAKVNSCEIGTARRKVGSSSSSSSSSSSRSLNKSDLNSSRSTLS